VQGSAIPVLFCPCPPVLSLSCPEFQDRTRTENIKTCPNFCPRPEDRTRTENNKTCPNFCPVKTFSLKIIYFLRLNLAYSPWISAKFCVGINFFLPRVNRPQRFQKSWWKFSKMIIGCPRLPEIRNLRIY
jgi:hypothetical protein